jgi:hypothetical protein
MCIASGLRMNVNGLSAAEEAFAERVGCYLIEYRSDRGTLADAFGPSLMPIGHVTVEPRVSIRMEKKTDELTCEMLTQAWRGTLDW